MYSARNVIPKQGYPHCYMEIFNNLLEVLTIFTYHLGKCKKKIPENNTFSN